MRQIRIIDKRTGKDLVSSGRLADNFWTRLRGLIGRPPLKSGEGLLIRPSNSVHCFFMSYPIDVIYVSREDVVLKIDEAMKPWRIGMPVSGARYVIEIPAGEAARRDVQPGDALEVIGQE